MKPAAKPKAKKRAAGSMTDSMRRFAEEYTVDFHGEHAAIRAGFAASSARQTASRLLARQDVQDCVRARMDAASKKTGITAERVLQETWGIATADVNDLVEFRRTCCRHCYGIDYGYQRTVPEMSRAQKEYLRVKREAIAKDKEVEATYEPFDEQGGIGYDARKPPVDTCLECFGHGVGSAYFKDTRTLSPAARAMYAGVKQTKDGYQMLMIDKNGALEKLFKHLGLYKADNTQKVDALAEFLTAVQNKGGKLPIKG